MELVLVQERYKTNERGGDTHTGKMILRDTLKTNLYFSEPRLRLDWRLLLDNVKTLTTIY